MRVNGLMEVASLVMGNTDANGEELLVLVNNWGGRLKKAAATDCLKEARDVAEAE